LEKASDFGLDPGRQSGNVRASVFAHRPALSMPRPSTPERKQTRDLKAILDTPARDSTGGKRANASKVAFSFTTKNMRTTKPAMNTAAKSQQPITPKSKIRPQAKSFVASKATGSRMTAGGGTKTPDPHPSRSRATPERDQSKLKQRHPDEIGAGLVVAPWTKCTPMVRIEFTVNPDHCWALAECHNSANDIGDLIMNMIDTVCDPERPSYREQNRNDLFDAAIRYGKSDGSQLSRCQAMLEGSAWNRFANCMKERDIDPLWLIRGAVGLFADRWPENKRRLVEMDRLRESRKRGEITSQEYVDAVSAL
jgi:hypothetical protein